MGKDPEENYQIRNILMTLDEYMITIWGALFYKDESKKEDLKNMWGKIKIFLWNIWKRYVDLWKGKYLFEDKFTLTDIVLASALPDAVDDLSLKEYPSETVVHNIGELI